MTERFRKPVRWCCATVMLHERIARIDRYIVHVHKEYARRWTPSRVSYQKAAFIIFFHSTLSSDFLLKGDQNIRSILETPRNMKSNYFYKPSETSLHRSDTHSRMQEGVKSKVKKSIFEIMQSIRFCLRLSRIKALKG